MDQTAKGTGKTGRCRKLPMLGGTSRIFLLEASFPSHEGGYELNLLLQIWDSLEFSPISPQTPVFLCNNIMSVIAGAPCNNPHGSLLSHIFISVL